MSSNMTGVNSGKMKRMMTRKSHSWWWDSHISPKNSKWLAENLEEMDRCVKEMLKLIEEEGDSFAKKAEMYYQKRPELISHVEDFYRMYRGLAERYDHVTGELRKNIQSELRSENSGNGSDFGSEPASPEPKSNVPKPSQRAAGFEYFLGSGGSSDKSKKGSDDSSSESESDSDDGISSSGLQQRIVDLENELSVVKENLSEHEQCRDLSLKVSELKNDLLAANEKLDHENMVNRKLETRIFELESEIIENKREIEDLKCMISENDEVIKQYKAQIEGSSEKFSQEKCRLESDIMKLETVINELKQENNTVSEENSSLRAEMLALSQSKAFLEAKLLELEADKAKEVSELKLSMDALKRKVMMAYIEKDHLSEVISVLTYEMKCRDERVHEMLKEIDEVRIRVKELEAEVEKQRIDIFDGAEGKREAIRQLCFSLDHYRDRYCQLRQLLQGHIKRPSTVIAV